MIRLERTMRDIEVSDIRWLASLPAPFLPEAITATSQRRWHRFVQRGWVATVGTSYEGALYAVTAIGHRV